MFRSKASLVAVIAALAGVISGSIAAAQADTGATGSTGTTGTTSTATQATITVNGDGDETVASTAPDATFQSAYLSALQAALSDAHTKATMLASQSGDTLGPVQNITEQSNDGNGCSGPVMFARGAARSTTSTAPSSHKPKPKHKAKPVTHAVARIADAPTSCGVEADVTVTYAMNGS